MTIQYIWHIIPIIITKENDKSYLKRIMYFPLCSTVRILLERTKVIPTVKRIGGTVSFLLRHLSCDTALVLLCHQATYLPLTLAAGLCCLFKK